MSSRRSARERVIQALYAFELGGGDADAILKRVIVQQADDDEATLRFAESLFLRTLDGRNATEEIIRRHTRNWEISRIALIDRLVLRMAICEILTFEDIPPKVSINEAIEVAKKFSTSKSGKFVNGILDAVVVELAAQGKLQKSGRGLIGLETILNAAAAGKDTVGKSPGSTTGE